MPNFNFRRFKYIALYTGAIIVIGATLYWFVDLAANMQTVEQNRSAIGRLWTAITSREGVVIWTGLIAVFVLATILVERRLDADRDLKWRRRKTRLEHRATRLDGLVRLSGEQKELLLTLQKRGGQLHTECLQGGKARTKEIVDLWERETASVLRLMLGEERSGMFLNEPIVPLPLEGYQAHVKFLAGRMKARMTVLNQIIKEYTR